ncbi:YheC/YheD family protein [Bacillus sp. NTK071]|uniref:YheC/YheD family endospore coat-associated protein n=1 Tax=Bacillus sp. NTK071 TaxID=2802175 RepID=UPI001A8C21BC|nr:YheC/YheD family protein [Bacillus sp. NTK071]MBN8208939.1 YheC/YheD family protein [Bacillus sp. NTK071]
MYVIKPYLKKDNTLIVSKATMLGRSGRSKETRRIQFGIKSLDVTLYYSDLVKENEVYLSSNVMKQLGILLSCTYELVVQDNKITIGPFIGILSELTNSKVAEMLPTYNSFVKGYRYIGGAIAVFSIEGINKEKGTIQGFLYHPKKKTWQWKTFPFPSVVMSIAEPSLTSSWKAFHEHMRHFELVLGGKVFNYPHFSKWEMYQMLLPQFKDYLPETALYKDVHNIREMLHKHGSVYIKPLNGRLGKRIYNVVKGGPHIVVKYDVNHKSHEEVLTNEVDSSRFFEEHLVQDAFLIQQTIPLKTHEQSVIDFRVMAAKNQKGQWQNLGIYSRYGARGQIVSNITAGGYSEQAAKTLKNVWKLTDKEVQSVEEEMERVVLAAIQTIEGEGYHLGNIGVDIGLDDQCNISIIEINHQNPDPYIALMAEDRKAFYNCRFQNMRYARYLGGF